MAYFSDASTHDSVLWWTLKNNLKYISKTVCYRYHTQLWWYVWAVHFSGVQFNTWSYGILSMAAILDLIMAVIQKCFGLRHHFPWPQKCRDSHQIHHHISLSRRIMDNMKTQLSLTNLRDAKACQKLLQFDVLTTLSMTILAYLHSFNCCCVWNLRNPEKFTENSNL